MASYRDDAMARLDMLAFYGGHVELRRLNDKEYRFRCPFHDDREASANVNVTDGLWFCHACNVGGSPLDFLMKQGMAYKDALAHIGDKAGLDPPSMGKRTNGHVNGHVPSHQPDDGCLPSEEQLVKWQEAALRNADLMAWFKDKRGFTLATVKAWGLGWNGQRVVIPVRDEAGTLVNTRLYLLNAPDVKQKMIGVTGHNEARLFPPVVPDDPIIVEGEWDTMLMHQQGFANTVTVTSGAGIWKPEFSPAFRDRVTTIIYDNDDVGRRGALKVAAILAHVAATVATVTIPGLPDKGDVTDFFVEQARDADELRILISDAPLFAAPGKVLTSGETVEVTLPMASDAKYQGVRVAMPVLVSGKAMTPYTIPSRFLVTCDMGAKSLCNRCPMQQLSGVNEVTLSAADPRTLRLMNVSDSALQQALRDLSGAVSNCKRPQVSIRESANVEELRLIPELDTAIERGDSEYVTRTGYLIGHGLRTNRSYRMLGYSHPDPKTQATVHLLAEAIPAQDNISAFTMTPETRELLTLFNGSPGERMDSIYSDYQRNVHRIIGRQDMQVAFDLAWHSVIAFYFNGSLVRRGWVEAMIVGDSGQGKSEMALALLAHYRLGERVQGEQASMAGLIGGLEKMGDTWILSWGKVPLNDKRLLIVDETQGLNPAHIEAMSDVRATGIAEVTKIRTERTNARCRIVWLANPSSGRPLAQYNQGVMALKDVFHKPEDIRRLDFALGVASGDVPFSAINTVQDAQVTPTHTSEAARQLILWAWSRTPDQVRFSEAATKVILTAASDFGRRYHSSIPIVEPADQRLKLARLSAAMAARTFSTDDTASHVVITSDHVDYVVDYLHRIYNARSLSYGEYSTMMQAGETVEDPDHVWEQLGILDNATSLLEFLRNAKAFRKSEMEEVVGYDSSQAREVIRTLSSFRLIRTSSAGYVKQPAFIALLRERGGQPVVTEEPAPWDGG